MNFYYFIAALIVLFGGVLIFARYRKDRPLELLSFFVAVSMIRPVTDSHLAWVVELCFISLAASFKMSTARDNKWYLTFLVLAFISFLYSSSPTRGIPGFVMYCFPIFYYALTTTAIKKNADVDRLFQQISKSTWLLLLLAIASLRNNYLVFSYFGMGICTIPVYLFVKTRKKRYIIHFLICLLPALLLVKRTPLLGIAAAIMVFSILIYKRKALIPSILAIALGVVLVISIPSFRGKIFMDSRISSIHDITSSNLSHVNMNGRLDFWRIALEKYFHKAPVFGSGIGTVKAFLQSDLNTYKETFSLMHNDWLLVLCEQGLVGLLSLLLFMISILKKSIHYAADRYPKGLRLISAACAGSVVSTMIHMFFENCMNSFIFSIAFVFYAILNTCVSSYQSSINHPTP